MVKSKKQSKRAVLVIEDGRTFQGTSLGAEGETLGEVVFNTSMTGYQEILGDPSYDSQIVTMTNPHIGNTGINPTDIESAKARVAGFVVSECSSRYSNWRAEKGLDEYLKDCGIVGIEGIDTRALTLHIREKGAMKGIISTTDFNYETLMNKLFKYPGLVGRDLVKNVSVAESYIYQPGSEPEAASDYYTYTPGTPETMENPEAQASEEKHYIAVIDCGIKYNILRIFSYFNCNVIVVPATYSYAEILSLNPDGVFISNGPGDPEGVPYVIDTVKQLIEYRPDLPLFGICLGHQIQALALGGQTYKLKFGHRGANHPVMDLATGKIEITTQNHGFAVKGVQEEETGAWKIEGCDDLEVTHLNLNDHTIEGFRHKSRPVFSVQYHPESSAGPHDSWYLFGRFIDLVKQRKSPETTPAGV